MGNGKITVVVANINNKICTEIEKYLNAQMDIKVLAVCNDGLDAYTKIKELTPDVAVLDVVLPKIDGLGVLEKIAEDNLVSSPICIMLSSINQDIIACKAIELGADYYLLKPFKIEILATRIRMLSNYFLYNNTGMHIKEKTYIVHTRSHLQRLVDNLLIETGIPSKLRGYRYAREAIMLSICDMDFLDKVTTRLYPSVATFHNSTVSRVERDIRHAIKVTWEREATNTAQEIFSQSGIMWKSRPTNSEFISMLAYKLCSEMEFNMQKNKLLK